MKLPPARLAAFLAKVDAGVRGVLVYGPDAGLVRERADRIANSICADPRDAFRVADLGAATLAADPARLHDEAASISLGGGRRVIRVRDAGDGVGSLFERFVADPPPGDSLVVVEAGELPTRSSLRRAFEASPSAAAIACYADGRRELEELAREVLGARAITISGEALHYLVDHLGGDRLASRRELEKLALFAGDRGHVDLAGARASIGDSAAVTVEDVVFAVGEGDADALERLLLRAFQEGEAPVTILRAVMRHFQRLHLTGSRIAAGESEMAAMQALRPPPFFKVQDRFKRQLGRWPVNRTVQALEILVQAELNSKRAGIPAETICREALSRLVRGASVQMRRAGQ